MTDSEELEALRGSVRALLVRTPGADAWPRLCGEIGVAGLGIPEAYGGAGAGLPEVCAVLEELGRTLTPCPMLGSSVLAAEAVLAAGDEAAMRRLLPGIAAGTSTAALVWAGAQGHWDPTAPVCLWDGRLHGEAHYVLDGASAEVFVVAARTDHGVGLFEVDPANTTRTETTPMDTTRALATVLLDHCPGRPIGDGTDHNDGADRSDGADLSGALARAQDVGCVALAAEQVGSAAYCLEQTVAYTKQRVQFGRPIAHFQALQHRMADLYVLVETARSAVWAATQATPDELPLLAAVAKTHCSEALSRVAAEMIQLHGGIAITWEHEAHRYFKRAHGSAQLFGHPREHITRLESLTLQLPSEAR